MVLKLRLENETSLPDGGPLSVSIEGKRGIDIGRDAHLDWTLPDPTRYISSKHCEIRYKDGGYWLHDVSTNGTFLNGADHRMHAPHRLRNGDRFSVGHYIVAVALDGAEEASQEGPRSVPPVIRPTFRTIRHHGTMSSCGRARGLFPRPLIRRSCDRRAKMRQSIPIFWIGRLTLVIRSTNRLRIAPHSRQRGPCRCPTILTGQRVRLRTGPHRHHHSRHRQIRAGLVVKLRRSTLRGRRLSRLLQSRGPFLQPSGQPIPTKPCRTQRSRASLMSHS